MREIDVNLGDRSYKINIGINVLDELGQLMRIGGLPRKVGVLSNPVLRAYVDRAIQSLVEADFDPWVLTVPSGDENKSLDTASMIYGEMLDHRMDRKSCLVALGGGMIGDLTGFVAATYMRGIPFVQVPTTLLAQVDASVGGKTAVNHPKCKNLVGAFHQPKLVLIDVATLKTLEDRDFSSGLAEVIKHGMILDRRFHEFIASNLSSIRSREPDVLVEMIDWSCRLKAEVVERDEREGGLRAILNFGHTIGHAIEALTGYERFRHGEAVAIGMFCAALISYRREMIGKSVLIELSDMLREANLPIHVPGDLDPEEIIRLIHHDKKVKAGKLSFILIDDIGSAKIVTDVDDEEIASAIREAQA